MNSTGISFRQSTAMDWFALLVACLLSMLLVTYPIFDFDFYWHLANGREMANTAHIVSEEVFSFTHPGEHFANHEWLAQLLFYKVWDTFGPYGLFALKLLIVSLISWLLFSTVRNQGQSSAIALLLTVLVVLAGLNRFHVRPELFSLLSMASLVFILYGFCSKRLPRMLLWAVPLVMVTWDWLHGAVYGFAFLSMFIVAENFKYRVKWFQHQSQLVYVDLKYLNLCFAVTLIAMLINPFGLRSYGIFVGYVVGEANFNSVISEFTPISWEYSKVFILMCVWLFLMALRNWRQVDITQLLTSIIFVLAAFRFSRMAGAAAIVMTPFIADLLKISMQETRKIVERRIHATTLVATTVLMMWYGVTVKFVSDEPEPDSDKFHYVNVYDLSFGYQMEEGIYPVGAVNFIKTNDLSGHLYNSGNVGAYLSYHITPERKIFQYNMGRVFGNPFYYVSHPDELAKWHIDYAIVDTDVEMSLFPDAQWANVYRDEASLLLVKRTPENEALIKRYEMQVFSPVYSDASLLELAQNPDVLPTLAIEMGDYLDYREDQRIAKLWARILKAHAELRHDHDIQILLSNALKYNPGTTLRDLLDHA